MNLRLPSRRKALKISAVAALLLVFTAGSFYLLALLRATSVLYSLSPTQPPRIVRFYRKFFQYRVAETFFSVPGLNGPLPIRMIFPPNEVNAPTVVLVHGLVPKGYRDPALEIVAVQLAQIGFRVVVPNLSAEQQMLMRPSDLDDIGTAIQWSAKRFRQRVTLVGISFGGGLVIAVADMPQYSHLLKLVFSYAGYNSTDRLGRYYIGDRVTTPDGQPYREAPPEMAPLTIALQYLGDMVPEQDIPVFRKVILTQLSSQSGAPASVDVLTPAQRALYDDLRTVKSSAAREKYHRLLERHRVEQAALSPHGHMQALHTPLYILHGTWDVTIPAGETQWTVHEIPPGADIHAIATPWLVHATLWGQTSFREKFRVGNFVCDFLMRALRPAPL